jgi:hypothetical protein
MTRMSKQGKRRHQSPKKRHANMSEKSGAKKESGYREHTNALAATEQSSFAFIPKIK